MGSATFEPSADLDKAILEAVRPQLREAADGIAGAAEANITFPGARSGPVEVNETDNGYEVALMGPFAHIDEWGGANSGPQAPLRRAAYASGHDFEEH